MVEKKYLHRSKKKFGNVMNEERSSTLRGGLRVTPRRRPHSEALFGGGGAVLSPSATREAQG